MGATPPRPTLPCLVLGNECDTSIMWQDRNPAINSKSRPSGQELKKKKVESRCLKDVASLARHLPCLSASP
jgi:hypothetical protein